MARIFSFLSWSGLACLMLLGCGRSTIDPEEARKVIRDVEKAKSLVQSEDYLGALPILDECVKSGLLQPTLLSEVIALRVRAFIHTGSLEQAQQDIDGLESISADSDVVHGLRYLYWQKLGNNAKAQAELRLAKQTNPKFKAPK